MELKKGSVRESSLLSEGPIACLILCRVCDTTVECFLKVALCRLCMHRKVFLQSSKRQWVFCSALFRKDFLLRYSIQSEECRDDGGAAG